MTRRFASIFVLQVFSACVFVACWVVFMQAQDSTSPMRLKLAELHDDWDEVMFRRKARRLQADLEAFEQTVDGG